MKKANDLFFLSAINDNVAVITGVNGLLTFHSVEDRGVTCPLNVEVVRVGYNFSVSYEMIHNGQCVATAKSDPVSCSMVYGIIAAIVNDAFPTLGA